MNPNLCRRVLFFHLLQLIAGRGDGPLECVVHGLEVCCPLLLTGMRRSEVHDRRRTGTHLRQQPLMRCNLLLQIIGMVKVHSSPLAHP